MASVDYDQMSPEEQAAYRKAKRERRAAKKQAARDLDRDRYRIFLTMRDAGERPAEIARQIGLSPAHMRAMVRRLGIEGGRPNLVRLGAWVNKGAAPAIQGLAERAGVSVEDMTSRILDVALAENGRVAVKILGKLALPKATRRGHHGEG